MVTTTETVSPPMMARASGAYCSLPASSPSAMGIMPSSVASEVIRMGRRRTRHDSTRRFEQRHALLVQDAGELDDQNAVRHHDAGHHDHAHQRHDVERAAGKQQNEHHADQAGRNGHEDDEGIDEGGELRHQDQVDQHDSDDQPDAEVVKGLVHVDHRAAHVKHGVAVVRVSASSRSIRAPTACNASVLVAT